MAAEVVARIKVGQILSSSPLQAKMTSFGSSFGGVCCIAASIETLGVSVSVVLIGYSPLPQDEAVGAAVLALFDQRVPGRLAPGLEVRHRPGIGGQHLDQFVRCHLLHLDCGLHDRNWAVEALYIETARDGHGFHRLHLLQATRPCGTVCQESRLKAHLATCHCSEGCGETGGCS